MRWEDGHDVISVLCTFSPGGKYGDGKAIEVIDIDMEIAVEKKNE